MKQKFYTLLLTAVFGLTGMNAWAQSTYEIGTAQDLMDFAEVVNSGETDANAVLTADIDMSSLSSWTAIGDWNTGKVTSAFEGHFDGQGHTIKNFTFTSNKNYFGLFGIILPGCIIENFTIEGTITINSNYQCAGSVAAYAREETNPSTIRNVHSKVNINNESSHATARIGGILGCIPRNNAKTVIENCTYSGTLNAGNHSGNFGGILGYVQNNNTTYADITNCLFDGKIKSEFVVTGDTGAQCGGIVGYSNSGNTTIKNCLSIGTFEFEESNELNIGVFLGRLAGNNATLTNNYYKNTGILVVGSSSGGTPKGAAPIVVTDAQLASGEVAFLLNKSVSGGTNWFQTLAVPAFELGAQQTYTDVQYVGTINGDDNNPKTQTTDITIVNNGDNTINIVLKNFSVTINGVEATVDEISLDNVATSVGEDGLTHFDRENGSFTIPTTDLPPLYQALVAQGYVSFTDIPFTLHGKLNETQIFSEIDIFISSTLGNKNVHIVVGTDDFPTADTYPTPNGTAKVYVNGRQHCDGTAYEGTSYSNQNLGMTQDSHNYVDGFCTFCGALDETYMAANSDGFFEIANEKQLVWFAAYVNQVSVSANAILMNDIDMTGVAWTPIGNASVAYTGEFDGQGKSISNFNYAATTTHSGLFGNINGATVQNFSISGNLASNQNYCGVIGLSKGSSKVKGIHSSLNIDIQFKGWAGGVVGGADGYIVIEECSFDGTFDTHNYADSKGGILGYANGATIKNCLFSGTLTGEANQHYGGILGYVNNSAFGGVQNCLCIGSVTTTNSSHSGVAAIIGNINSSTTVDGIFNNYWLEGSSYAGNNGVNAAVAEAPIEVTAEQLASGEVTYKLGEAWSQFLGSDTHPKLGTYCPVFYVGAAGYATLFDNSYDWALNGDATAYIGTANGQYIHLTAIDDIPMCTAVIIKGTYYNMLPTTATSDVTANELLGTEEDTEADGTMYVLAKPEGMEIGFYRAETGSFIPARKAYYQSTSGVKGFLFTDDDATGISDVNANLNANNKIYNIAGQRLSKMQKGINIVDNKKVLY